MKIEKNGLTADVSDDVAAALVAKWGWQQTDQRSLAPPRFVNPVELDKMILLAATGGKEVPANIDWTPCKRVAGTGVVEARLINGVVQFKGDLKYTQTAAGSFAGVQKLPDGFPPPSVDTNLTTWAIETGMSYKIGMIRLGVNREIGVSAPTGKFDTITFNGISYPVF
jgi:hypothetical protein